VLVSFDVGRIDDGRFAVSRLGEPLQDLVEHLQLIPTREFHVDRLPGTEALRKIAPRSTRFGDVKYRIHEGAIGKLRWPPTTTALWRQQRFDSHPILVAQLMPSHLQT
jgi:hypothetical protein